MSALISFDLLVKFQRPKITMGFFPDITLAKTKMEGKDTPVNPSKVIAGDPEKADTLSEKAPDGVQFTSNAQAGVKRIEAATTVWTKWHLVGAYAM